MRAHLTLLGVVAGALVLCSTAIGGNQGSDRITGTVKVAGDCEHVHRG